MTESTIAERKLDKLLYRTLIIFNRQTITNSARKRENSVTYKLPIHNIETIQDLSYMFITLI